MADYFDFLSKSAPESEFEEDAVLNMETDFEGDTEFENKNDDEDDGTDDDDEDFTYDYGNNYDGTYNNGNNEDTSTIEDQTYDSNTDMPEIDSKGSYTLDLIGQQRLSRQERSAAVNYLELPEATESTLMGHIDHSKLSLTLVA